MFTDMPCWNKEISKIDMVNNVKSGFLWGMGICMGCKGQWKELLILAMSLVELFNPLHSMEVCLW